MSSLCITEVYVVRVHHGPAHVFKTKEGTEGALAFVAKAAIEDGASLHVDTVPAIVVDDRVYLLASVATLRLKDLR